MGIGNFLKGMADSGPAYEVTGVDFGVGGRDVKPKKFGTEIAQDAEYVYARVRVTVRRPFEEVWIVKIFAPGGRMIQGEGLPEGCAGRYRCRFPESGDFNMMLPVGSVGGGMFRADGAYGWVLCMQDGSPLKSAFFHVVSYDAHLRRQGYMKIMSAEYAVVDKNSNVVMPFTAASKADFRTDMLYLQCRVKYAGISLEPHRIKLDVEIVRPDGSVTGFDTEADINDKGGLLTLPGWGNAKGTTYIKPGDYEYRILFEGNVLYRETLTVRRSLRDCAYLEVLSLTIHEDTNAGFEHLKAHAGHALAQNNVRVSRRGTLAVVMSYVDYGVEAGELFLKIVSPLGRTITYDNSPEGYSMRIPYTCENPYKMLGFSDIRVICSFRSLYGGSFVEGEYRLSLYVRNWRGDMVCLKACRVSVERR